MLTSTPDTDLRGLQQLIEALHRNGTPVRPDEDPELWRQLASAAGALFAVLGDALAGTDDPRLALELAGTARGLQHQATRMALTAADRVAATNAHQLDPAEYEQLRTRAADPARPARRCSGRPSFKNPAELLAAWLHIPFPEARQQVLDAGDLVGRRDAAGSPLPPRFPHLATLFADPGYNPEQVRAASGQLAKHEPADTSFDGIPCAPTLRHADGRTVEEHAAEVLRRRPTARESERLVKTLVNDAAADAATSTRAALRLGLHRLPVRNPRCREYLLRVGLADAERLESAIAQANNPRTEAGQAARNTSPDDDAPAEPAERPDFLPDDVEDSARWDPEQPGLEPTPAERALSALMDLVGSMPTDSGARKKIRPRLVVHLQVEDLRKLAEGHAQTAHGINLPAGELRHLLCEADIISAVFNAKGQLLDYGRAYRLVPPAMREMVLARDRGCLVPGCCAPPGRLQIHHIKPWYLGGTTSMDNLGPMCDSHHHAADNGEIQVVVIDGLPYVVMPKHIDPEQKPRRNRYWNPGN
ncbi:HNH endonuclease [Glutamicibacter sp. MNS18]|uniref:HNH endonuclease signature motif containing protein n=1 Tax=Glutamicibacter sp. MNS18 TaxID=2989817 RepID=UPI002235F594|nr:HNH endonuclease signature motif containing protein [Glutamicibacter sp. MNS18]MCW4467069.1 HNH endonuclease [Glutamicibacter sp. MNS18]